ncbi:hypothetical protein QBC39DRAFT_375758 [Podospora conica]|nr:hypothetical protein QBC39DRAFT_375758 [Schizothecium conicum]
MADRCDREVTPDLPADIRDTCARISAQLDQFIVDQNIINEVHTLKRKCLENGRRVWPAALISIPFPARHLVEAIADTKAIPESYNARISKLCTRFSITRKQFDTFFYGASATNFFEKLTKLGNDHSTLNWASVSRALSKEREKRLAATRNRNFTTLHLWMPMDIQLADMALKGMTLAEMEQEMDARRRHRSVTAKRSRPAAAKGMGGTPRPHGQQDAWESSPPLDLGRGILTGTDEYGGDISSNNPSGPTTPAAKRCRQSPSADNELFANIFTTTPDPTPFAPDPQPEPERHPLPDLTPSVPKPQPEPEQHPPPGLPAPRPPPAANTPTATISTSSLPLSWQAGMVNQDRQGLLHPKGWLTGATMNMALDAVTAVTVPRRFFAVSTDILVATTRAGNHPVYTARLRDQDMLLLPLHICTNHWALATLDRTTKAASVYDSIVSATHEEAAEDVISRFLAEFLGEDVHTWHFTTAASPQQADGSSCGIFALVAAIHVVSARTIPTAPYNVKMWRLVLAYLVCPESVDDEAIWPYSLADDARCVALAAAPSPEVAALEQQYMSRTCTVVSALDFAAAIQEQAGQTLAKIKVASRERRRVVSELKPLEALINAARDVVEHRPLARMLVERLGPRVAQAMTDGAASVAFFRQQIETAEVRWRGRTTA